MYVLLKTKSLDDGEPFKASANINMRHEYNLCINRFNCFSFVGSGIAIHYAEKTAIFFGVPQIIIGLTIIALGTSLPELATAITALKKGKTSNGGR